MESNEIKFYSSLPLISHIMPYFSRTHQSFLLLSRLNKQSRLSLCQNLSQFLSWMRPCNLHFTSSALEVLSILPSDLFTVSIFLETASDAAAFVEICRKMSKKQGCCISGNYLHSALCADQILLSQEAAGVLLANREVVDQIRVVWDKGLGKEVYWTQGMEEWAIQPMMDGRVKEIFDAGDEVKQVFRRIEWINFGDDPKDKKIEQLKEIEKEGIWLSGFSIWWENSGEFEDVINPRFF